VGAGVAGRSLVGMRILVTGSARAIGAATATELTRRGHHVVATARDLSLLDDVDAAQRLALDVTDESSIDAALAECGAIDAVVNNAAISGAGPLEDFPIERLLAMFQTNTIGALRLIQRLTPAWRERGSGVIVNVSSVQGRVSSPLEGAYSASKYALEAMSETLHYELRHFGIRTVIIQPGYIAPGMKDSPRHEGPEVYRDLWDQWTGVDATVTGPSGRPGPELVGAAIADAIEQADTPLRVPVGSDAEMILATRHQLYDQTFESVMRETLDFTW
jgi:NAD(P)-dependent dehydrogenase (short-subunit alcohol dehydrogenase family)